MSTSIEHPRPPSPARRRFIQVITGLFATTWGIITLVPLYRYLRPPSTGQLSATVSSVTVGDTTELPVGHGKNFQFGSVPGIVIHTQDGQFHAFNATCTHLGCTVQYRPDMGRIWCACHGGQYNPETGAVLAGPPPRPLTPLKVAVADGKIVVSS